MPVEDQTPAMVAMMLVWVLAVAALGTVLIRLLGSNLGGAATAIIVLFSAWLLLGGE